MYDRKSRESDDLCKMELKATATIRRLAEENEYVTSMGRHVSVGAATLTAHLCSQLLEFLLDYNELETVRPRNLVDLAVDTADPKPTRAAKTLDYERIPTPPPEANVPDEGSPSRVALQHAQVSAARARHIAKLIQGEKDSPNDLVALLHVPHSRSVALASKHMSEELCPGPNPPTYLAPAQEDEYLDAMDKALASRSSSALNGGRSSLIPGSAAKAHMSQTERDRDEEREVALRNPVSVYNWLRRNQPQVFLQDKEAGPGEKTNGGKADGASTAGAVATPSEKPVAATTSKPARGTAKRASSAANKNMVDALPPEYIDDDGVLHGGHAETSTPAASAAAAAAAAASSKGKRKREEDPGYRPKGGSSSRPSKKKRKSGGGKANGKGDRDRDRDHDGDEVGMDSPAADGGGSSTARAAQGSSRSKKAVASSTAGRRSTAHARVAAAAGD